MDVLLWLYFGLLVFIVLYLPGRFILRMCGLQPADTIQHMALSMGVGVSAFMLGMYIFSWLHIGYLYFVIIVPSILLEGRGLLRRITIKSMNGSPFELAIIVLGSMCALFITARSGVESNGQMLFYGVNSTDAVFHISLINNLVTYFPPTHAGMAGIALHGYNFLYDLLVASFAKYFYLQPLDLFFRYFSLFTSLFYGVSCLALARFLKMKTVTTNLFLFLAYFAQGTIFVFTYFHIVYDPGIVQPLGNIVDPSVLFSVSLFFLGFITIFSISKKVQIIPAVLLISVLPMIKIYTAFLFFAALGFVCLTAFVTKKKERWLLSTIFIGAGIVGGLVYAPINLGVGKLIFTPFLLYTHFLESYAPLNHSDWWMKMLVYFEHKNYLRIIQNYLIVLALFFIPSLSLRLFGVSSIKQLMKRSFYTLPNIFLLSAGIVEILLPSFFIQNIAVFVIIQFLWITYFLLLIPAAYGLSSVYTVLPKWAKVVFIICVVLISIPDTRTLLQQYSKNPTIISSSTVSIAKDVRTMIPQKSGVIVLNTELTGQRVGSMYSVPIFSALSGHSVYYEPEVLEFSGLESEVKKRTELIAALQTAITQCSDTERITALMKEAKSSYLVALKKNDCLVTLPTLALLSQKGEAALYKLR